MIWILHSPPGLHSLQSLKGMLDARLGNDPSIVLLSARSGDPVEAERVANTWARLFVVWANDLFGESNLELEHIEGPNG